MSAYDEKYYQVRCKTEGNVWVDHGWSETKPTTCPNNVAHEVSRIKFIDRRGISIARVKEETTHTGGHYMCISKTFTAAKNATTTDRWSYGIPISVLAGKLKSKNVHKGDKISIYATSGDSAAGTAGIVGALSASAATGDTTVTVYPGLVNLIDDGYYIEFVNTDTGMATGAYDKDATRPKYMITDYSLVDNTISFTSDPLGTNTGLATSHSAYPPGIPTYVVLKVYMVKDYQLNDEERHVIGEVTQGGSHIPGDYEINFEYQNLTPAGAVDKDVTYRFEFLY
uniref:Uncharacterized protein n=1 Tax=viral metagenome TaxID=1070528 RepID=A0A6C0CLK8_9ZZZZ